MTQDSEDYNVKSFVLRNKKTLQLIAAQFRKMVREEMGFDYPEEQTKIARQMLAEALGYMASEIIAAREIIASTEKKP